MRVNGVLTRTSEFTVTTLAEESGVADPWSVSGAFTDEFDDATASKDRWIVLGDSVVTYSGGQMNIGDSLNVKAVTGSENCRTTPWRPPSIPAKAAGTAA